ncbi:MAG: PadR family transcriptional regulator [Clostridiaceae bacterium]|nr:PadR family transcriptional regulator [Eubacteriales bacterium]
MYETEDLLLSLVTELKRGSLVLCVLGCAKEPAYGYALQKRLGEIGVDAEANTLYPLLRRLEKQGLLKSSWELSESKPRKYYARTAEGAALYERLKAFWGDFSQNVTKLLSED